MSYLNTPNNTLSYLLKKYPKEFKSMIDRFFKYNSKNVMNEVHKINPNSLNDVFYNIFKRYRVNNNYADKDIYLGLTPRQQRFCKNLNALELGDELIFQNKASSGYNNDIIYLDFGCNDAALTAAIVNEYNINPKNVYCTDIIDKPEICIKNGYTYINTSDINNMKKIPNNVNFLTMINVIHHIPPDMLISVLTHLKNILVKGAIILIKEHDSYAYHLGKKSRYLITEWHNLYQKVNDEKGFMGYLYLIDYPHIKVLMMNINAIAVEYIPHDEDDILSEYFAMFKVF